MPISGHRAAGRRVARALPTLLAALLLGGAACDAADRLLRVQTPSRLPEDQLRQPQNALLIVASAQADFECAYGAYVVTSGLAAGELADASQTATRWSYDRRDVLPTDAHYATFPCEAIGVYTPLQTARYTADRAVADLTRWTDAQVPNRQRLLATAASYAAYATLLLGEGFCAGAIDVGGRLTSAELFERAEARFDVAIAAATAAGDATLLSFARVGRARARLDQGDLAGAAADAELVPVGFVYNATAAVNADRRANRVVAQNNAARAVTVAPAYRNLTVGGIPDPRVKATDAGRNAADQLSRLWLQGKYTTADPAQLQAAPLPIATGVEAQLIVAEARGGSAGADLLDALRARYALPALTAEERADFTGSLFEARRRELWLQGTRWFDLRRATLPFEPTAGLPYPKGGSYGDQRCWPLPDAERLGNPNLG